MTHAVILSEDVEAEVAGATERVKEEDDIFMP